MRDIHGDKWELDCTDRCSLCYRLPKKMTFQDGSTAFYCRGNCHNESEKDKKIALAICKWNIKQRELKKGDI